MIEWKFLYGDKNYQVSNTGIIRSTDRVVSAVRGGVLTTVTFRGRVLAQRCTKKNPHMLTGVMMDGVQTTVYIHKAVADHFVEKSPAIKQAEARGESIRATHIVDDYANNHYTNITWITQADLIRTQPNRLADSGKAWRTRRKIYGKGGMAKTSKKFKKVK